VRNAGQRIEGDQEALNRFVRQAGQKARDGFELRWHPPGKSTAEFPWGALPRRAGPMAPPIPAPDPGFSLAVGGTTLSGMDRRYFLGSAISAGAALRSSALASPNDTVRVACVGFRGRGRDHIRA